MNSNLESGTGFSTELAKALDIISADYIEAKIIYDSMVHKHGSDAERLAVEAICLCLKLTTKNLLLEKLVTNLSQLKPQRGRPRGPVKAGMYVPRKLQIRRPTIGAPKRHKLPYQTKVHALNAHERMLLINSTNAAEGARLELMMNNLEPDENIKLAENIARRIRELNQK